MCKSVADERCQQHPTGQRLRRTLMPERRLRFNCQDSSKSIRKYKSKKRDAPAPKPFASGKRFEEFVVIVVKPQGS